jgi:flavin-dependent dehydrogenase
VGVGFFCSGAGPVPSLHALWRRFAATFEPAAAIVRESELLEPFRGAPLRAGLAGARFGRPGLVAIGEAAAMTYSATGEGIGKAMESGLLAARAAMEASADSRVSAHEAYEAEFRRRFEPRYTAYRRAQACAARPWLLDFLAWRANAGTFVRGELEALVDERGDPRRLLSAGGFAAALFR